MCDSGYTYLFSHKFKAGYQLLLLQTAKKPGWYFAKCTFQNSVVSRGVNGAIKVLWGSIPVILLSNLLLISILYQHILYPEKL